MARPERRVWPPRTSGPITSWIGWGEAPVTGWLRYCAGPVLIVAGNVDGWSEVIGFGAEQTTGAEGRLKTDGLCRMSRNPRDVNDIAILICWGLASAFVAALPAIVAGSAVLIAFPFAEEPWLTERHGTAYRDDRARVRWFP